MYYTFAVCMCVYLWNEFCYYVGYSVIGNLCSLVFELYYIGLPRRVARNSQWGGAVWGVWGRSPQPPEANGGLGAKPPAAGGWGFGGKAPSRRRHGGVGAEPPALENFAFFCKINFILGLF